MSLSFLILLGLSAVLLYGAWRFYHQVNWGEPAEFSPDVKEMRKREAELQYMEEFLGRAHAEGKLSTAFVEEFKRFHQNEVAHMKQVQDVWNQRKSGTRRPGERRKPS